MKLYDFVKSKYCTTEHTLYTFINNELVTLFFDNGKLLNVFSPSVDFNAKVYTTKEMLEIFPEEML